MALVQQFVAGVHDGLEVGLAGNKLELEKLKEEFPTRVR